MGSWFTKEESYNLFSNHKTYHKSWLESLFGSTSKSKKLDSSMFGGRRKTMRRKRT
jgi:hypothetical protein